MTQGMTIDQFMQHTGRGSGGRGSRLGGWKEKGTVTVWLSCNASICTRWSHGFYRCEPRENKETKEKTVEVWQDKLTCFETEDDLGKRYFRDKQTGEREYPPVLCPDCKMSEDIHQRCLVGLLTAESMLRRDPKVEVAAIEAELRKRGEIWWLSPLFAFKGTDPSKEVVMHAGGMFHSASENFPAFANKKLTAAHKALMARVPKELGGPLYFQNKSEPNKEVWRQNFQPKMEYAFVVVDADHPENGLSIAVETSLLGDKMKTEIGKEMKRAGANPERGNPLLHPYPFRWDYNATEQEFSKKYDATALTSRLTPAIEKLIRDASPPNEALAKLLAKPNLATHRARLEKYAVGGGKLLPFDQYFVEALKVEASAPEPAAAAERPAPEVGRERPAPAPRAPAPAAPPPDDEEVDCDATLPSGQKCGAVMKMSDPVCPSCGFVYDVQPAAPPPPPARPTRSQAKAARGASPAPAPAPAPQRGNLGAAAPPEDDLGNGSGGYPGDADDDIPFLQACDSVEDSVLRRFRRAVNF